MSIRIVQRVVLLAFVLVCAAQPASADSRGVRSEIFEAVDRDRNFGPYEIEIDVRMGNVVLFGDVASEQAKLRVEEIARGLRGVKSVSNQIKVNPALVVAEKGSPSDLANKVREAVLARGDLGSYQLNVKSLGATVTLTGAVSRAQDSAVIEEIARSVAGVDIVLNQISLPQQANDADITAAVLAALREEGKLSLEGIDVSTAAGVVTVRGSRPDHRVRDEILSVVLGVPGVRDVRSELQ